MDKTIRQNIESRLYRCDDPKWERVINSQVERLTEEQRELFRLRYVNKETERYICSSLHIDRSTYYRWIAAIIESVALSAAYHRLINPSERS